MQVVQLRPSNFIPVIGLSCLLCKTIGFGENRLGLSLNFMILFLYTSKPTGKRTRGKGRVGLCI